MIGIPGLKNPGLTRIPFAGRPLHTSGPHASPKFPPTLARSVDVPVTSPAGVIVLQRNRVLLT